MTETFPLQSTDPLRQPDTILDQRFRLGEFLGDGPIHSVHQAYDILEGREVCLKIPKPKFRDNEGFAMRYRRDLLDVMMLSDPTWLTPLLLAEHDGVPIQVLPIIRATPFVEWFESIQRQEDKLSRFLTQCLKALERFRRASGRIHGSIKPSNLYVTESDEPLFTDLAATGRLEDHFAEKARSGEPVYCSPEQLSGERAEVGTDLYSLGLVVYKALARRHPYFTGEHHLDRSSGPEQLLSSLLGQLQSRPTPPSHFAEDVPRWADRFLARCLDPHPNERFESASEALAWLKTHAVQEHHVSEEQRALPPAGREKEMEFLTEELHKVLENQDGGTIIRLQGSLGTGKTRCLDWLVSKAKAKGMKVVQVEPTAESGLHLQSVMAAIFEDFPDIATEAQPVVESLVGIAIEEPLFMLVRDIQQGDDTLVEFLRELKFVLSELPLLLILVDEDTEFRSGEMEKFVQELERSLSLGPLDRRAIANLIEEKSWTAPNPSVTSWVHKVSGGNALHACLIVEYLLANSLVTDQMELAWASSPPTDRPTLEEIVDWKLQGLNSLSRSLLESAAVLGQPFRLSTLNAITYRNEEEVDQAVSEGVARGLLEMTAPGGAISYRWTHPKFQKSLLDSLHNRRKQRIHRLAAAFYSQGEPEPAKMAFHFLRAGDTPELFYWGSLAIERALDLRRRGECSFWMNVLLSRVPNTAWLGPDVEKAKLEITRDQAEALDLVLWPKWLRCLSGRSQSRADAQNTLLVAQHALRSNLAWEDWSLKVEDLVPTLGAESKDKATLALQLLEQEWKTRCPSGEPFPTQED